MYTSSTCMLMSGYILPFDVTHTSMRESRSLCFTVGPYAYYLELRYPYKQVVDLVRRAPDEFHRNLIDEIQLNSEGV